MKRKLWIERLWSVMGGLLFSILPLFQTGVRFNIETWWKHMRFDKWGNYSNVDEFVIGLIFTFIFVKSLRKYNETN